MLSRLISLLSRIPAVKWAVNRLRPPPHSGSLDVAPSAADEQPATVALEDTAPAINTDVESPSAAPSDNCLSDDTSLATPAEVEPVVVDEVSAASVEIESEVVDAPELISSDPPADLLTDDEPEVVEDVPASFVELEAIEAPEPVIRGEVTSDDAEIAPVVAEQTVIASIEVETAPVETAETVLEDEPASAASLEIEPVAASETPAVLVEAEIAAPEVAEQVEVAAAPPAPKLRARPVEPADRAALIRQRWAETGIRMWNPRLHGTGEATLNIQGRIGLLPPEPGETMPRYDKLEFKMLGGQIVCEGIIVEAPAHAGQRSFTRLAEPRGAGHSREPVRERQAALA